MSNYENEYLDGEDKRIKILPIILFIALIVIILVIVISCGMKEDSNKNSHAYLSYIRLSSGELYPKFSKDVYSYDAIVSTDVITVSCQAEDLDTKTEGCNKNIELTEDKTVYTIKSTDNDNSKTYILNIIKKQMPDSKNEIKVSVVSSKLQDEKGYKLTANVEPNNLKITYKWYKDDKEISNSNTKDYVATTSGNYYVKVVNEELNLDVKSNEVYIEIKKEEKPTGEYSLKINSIKGNASSWVKSVTLSINATASNGLAINAYSFDSGKTYQKSNSKSFTSNQTVKVVVKDSKGNVISKNVTISKIDNTKPSVTIGTSSETDSDIVLNAKVNPGSTTSGYKYQWYKDGEVIKNATSKTYKTNKSGIYKVKVTTGSGNSTTSKDYNFIPLVEKCPMIYAKTKDNKYVPEKFWMNEEIRITVVPPRTIQKYDVYKNSETGYDFLSNQFKLVGTYNNTTSVTVRLIESGQRYLKIETYDQKGNKTTCYSRVYYIR